LHHFILFIVWRKEIMPRLVVTKELQSIVSILRIQLQEHATSVGDMFLHRTINHILDGYGLGQLLDEDESGHLRVVLITIVERFHNGYQGEDVYFCKMNNTLPPAAIPESRCFGEYALYEMMDALIPLSDITAFGDDLDPSPRLTKRHSFMTENFITLKEAVGDYDRTYFTENHTAAT
jgi:hypothetical protein